MTRRNYAQWTDFDSEAISFALGTDRQGKWCRARAARWDLPVKLPMKFSPERPHNRTSPECTPRVEKLSALRSRRVL